jgi:hypothetical protein
MEPEKKFGTEAFNTSLDTISTEERSKEVLHYMETWGVSEHFSDLKLVLTVADAKTAPKMAEAKT